MLEVVVSWLVSGGGKRSEYNKQSDIHEIDLSSRAAISLQLVQTYIFILFLIYLLK